MRRLDQVSPIGKLAAHSVATQACRLPTLLSAHLRLERKGRRGQANRAGIDCTGRDRSSCSSWARRAGNVDVHRGTDHAEFVVTDVDPLGSRARGRHASRVICGRNTTSNRTGRDLLDRSELGEPHKSSIRHLVVGRVLSRTVVPPRALRAALAVRRHLDGANSRPIPCFQQTDPLRCQLL